MDPNNVNEIFDAAIEREQAAADFYNDLAQRTKRSWMKEVFEQFATEELAHKHKLIAIKEGRISPPRPEEVADLKISDYVVEVEASGELDYQQALVLAMDREKSSFRLYDDLAERVSDPELKQTLQWLAQEEAKHKLRFEVEYDEYILSEG